MIDGFLRVNSGIHIRTNGMCIGTNDKNNDKNEFLYEIENQQKPKKGNKKRKVWEKVRFERKRK